MIKIPKDKFDMNEIFGNGGTIGGTFGVNEGYSQTRIYFKPHGSLKFK